MTENERTSTQYFATIKCSSNGSLSENCKNTPVYLLDERLDNGLRDGLLQADRNHKLTVPNSSAGNISPVEEIFIDGFSILAFKSKSDLMLYSEKCELERREAAMLASEKMKHSRASNKQRRQKMLLKRSATKRDSDSVPTLKQNGYPESGPQSPPRQRQQMKEQAVRQQTSRIASNSSEQPGYSAEKKNWDPHIQVCHPYQPSTGKVIDSCKKPGNLSQHRFSVAALTEEPSTSTTTTQQQEQQPAQQQQQKTVGPPQPQQPASTTTLDRDAVVRQMLMQDPRFGEWLAMTMAGLTAPRPPSTLRPLVPPTNHLLPFSVPASSVVRTHANPAQAAAMAAPPGRGLPPVLRPHFKDASSSYLRPVPAPRVPPVLPTATPVANELRLNAVASSSGIEGQSLHSAALDSYFQRLLATDPVRAAVSMKPPPACPVRLPRVPAPPRPPVLFSTLHRQLHPNKRCGHWADAHVRLALFILGGRRAVPPTAPHGRAPRRPLPRRPAPPPLLLGEPPRIPPMVVPPDKQPPGFWNYLLYSGLLANVPPPASQASEAKRRRVESHLAHPVVPPW